MLTYPKQDAADLRADAVRNLFDGLRRAHQRTTDAHDDYRSASLRTDIPARALTAAHRVVMEQERRFQEAMREAQAAVLGALDEAEVPVVHRREVDGG